MIGLVALLEEEFAGCQRIHRLGFEEHQRCCPDHDLGHLLQETRKEGP
jgi:hypothetical protein